MNLDMPLEVFLPPPSLPDIHLLLSKDWNGINNGNFFVRVNKWSADLFSSVIGYPLLDEDADLPWRDQTALGNVLDDHEYFGNSAVYCPPRWFNPFKHSDDGEVEPTTDLPDFRIFHPGDLLVHFAGEPRVGLDQIMAPWVAVSNEERPAWNIPVEHSRYPNETASFWEEFERAPYRDSCSRCGN